MVRSRRNIFCTSNYSYYTLALCPSFPYVHVHCTCAKQVLPVYVCGWPELYVVWEIYMYKSYFLHLHVFLFQK